VPKDIKTALFDRAIFSSKFGRAGFNAIFERTFAALQVTGNWILATNFWDDTGVWDDAETWND